MASSSTCEKTIIRVIPVLYVQPHISFAGAWEPLPGLAFLWKPRQTTITIIIIIPITIIVVVVAIHRRFIHVIVTAMIVIIIVMLSPHACDRWPVIVCEWAPQWWLVWWQHSHWPGADVPSGASQQIPARANSLPLGHVCLFQCQLQSRRNPSWWSATSEQSWQEKGKRTALQGSEGEKASGLLSN